MSGARKQAFLVARPHTYGANLVQMIYYVRQVDDRPRWTDNPEAALAMTRSAADKLVNQIGGEVVELLFEE